MKTRVLELGLSLVFCLGLSACNKEQFYQKDYLGTPSDVPTVDGSANGGTQGGVDGTTTGGSTGGSTGGVDGTTAGGSTGGSTGGVDGTTAGGSTGGSAGGVDGTTAGGSTGGSTGGVDGTTAGGSTGGSTGGVDGTTTGGSTGGSTGGQVTGGTTGGSNTGGTNGSTAGGTTGGVGQTVTEIFHQSAESSQKLDIVWVIDNSGSMSDEQDALGTNFSAFIDDFILKNIDFKMAITTTDTSTSYKKGRMVTGSDSKLTSAMAQANPAQFKSDFKNLVYVGTRGSGSEKGLEASEGFMQRYASTFLRSDAYLAVVIISDEEDQSAKTVAEYTNFLKTFKSSEGLVKIYSVVDVNNTNCCQTGVTTGSERYKLASKETSGVVADITQDFYQVLEQMGGTLLNLLDSFALASAPLSGTLKVYVNNVETTNFTYDTVSHSIKFPANALPPIGAEIKVVYSK